MSIKGMCVFLRGGVWHRKLAYLSPQNYCALKMKVISSVAGNTICTYVSTAIRSSSDSKIGEDIRKEVTTVHRQSAQAESARAESARAESARAESARAESAQTECIDLKPID